MNQKIKYAGLLAILPLVLVSLITDLVGQADAQKSEGNPGHVSPKSYGSANNDKICGDRLCSTPEGSKDPKNVGRAR